MRDNQGVMTRARAPKADRILSAAESEARDALADEVGPEAVGAYEGSVTEDDRLVTHFFAATDPAYTGWRWAVTLTRAPRAKSVTVNEVVLLPGERALVAPEWVAWKDRVDPEDLGPGDLVPVEETDPRLVPGYLEGDELLDAAAGREIREVVREVGLGRERVLSAEGREWAADRWYAGDGGPDTAIAKSAPGRCVTCGFLTRMAGPLGNVFGVCANSSSPSDGTVVSFDHGCGAHSDVRAEHVAAASSPTHDTLTWESWDIWGDADVDYL